MHIVMFGSFLIAFLIALITTPSIIRIAAAKHLMDEPDEQRKFHKVNTPTLGGVAIFAGTIFSFSFFTDYFSFASEIKYMTSGLILLFFTGIRDDISPLPPLKKLAIQIVSAALITVPGNLYLTNLWGMFGISEIPNIFGILLTLMIIVSLINAFNLIDGANGLAGGLGFIASSYFGLWFYIGEYVSLCILSFALAGSLLGFLFFNFHRGKIFMGDTGSMMVGFIISILAIKFIENNRIPGVENSSFYIKAAPAVAVSVVAVPLFDMLRVFVERLKNRQNPLIADRRHIHHLLLDAGLNHTSTSVLLYILCFGLISVGLMAREFRSLEVVLLLLIIYILLIWALKRSKRKGAIL